MGQRRQENRQQSVTPRRCFMGVLSFNHLEATDHVVRIVNISSHGVGVESDEQLEPGLVWFHTSVEDNRGGILLWSRKEGDRYRAGIQFLSLRAEDERLLRYWPPCPGNLRPCTELEELVAAWMRAAGRNQEPPGADMHP